MSWTNIDDLREQLLTAYGRGGAWEDRVKKMPAKQVIAIYQRILETTPKILTEGRFAYAPDKKEEFHQMTIFEYNLERRLENERKGIREQLP